MIERARHVPLRPVPWDPSDIATAIEEIVLDALGHFDNEGFWPAHPLDELRRGGNSSVYLGASGVIWALDYLWRAGATKSHRDFRPVLSQLLERTGLEMQSFGDYAKHGSLLCGDLGTALVIMRLAPTLAIADIVHARVTANMELPVRELMWGLPGSMLACIHMAEMADAARWRGTFEAQAKRLLDDLQDTTGSPIWTQDLYGTDRALTDRRAQGGGHCARVMEDGVVESAARRRSRNEMLPAQSSMQGRWRMSRRVGARRQTNLHHFAKARMESVGDTRLSWLFVGSMSPFRAEAARLANCRYGNR